MLPELRAWNAEVIGVSSDPFDRQCEFAQSLELSFPLVADPDGAVAALYHAHRPLLSLDRRVTYVIDPDGRIAAAFHHEIAVRLHDADVRWFLEKHLGPSPGRARPSGRGDAERRSNRSC
jgi:peroxiredoxin Q/BCP